LELTGRVAENPAIMLVTKAPAELPFYAFENILAE
jgi:hypothetical protein